VAELLLEILSEEIPARMQARAADDLKRLASEKLQAAGLTFEALETYVTPRRLALVAEGLPERQPDVAEERRGPKEGAPEQALQGFLKAAGLASLDQAELRETPKGRFYFAVRRVEGRAARTVLPEILVEVLRALGWPKSMRWAEGEFRWVRPLQGLVAVFAGEPLQGSLDLGRGAAIAFGDSSVGHRFLAPEPFVVRDFAGYRDALRERFVLLDPAERRQAIVAQCSAAAHAAGLAVKPDSGLVDEVTGLVEWPCVLTGRIAPELMGLPPEVLTTSMRSHQRYFSLVKPDGTLADRFLLVANMEAPAGSELAKTIVAGNERVLRARLADAAFFWEQDRRHRLETRVPALKPMVFHAQLGSLEEKVLRVAVLARSLAPRVGAEVAAADRAAFLAKADLTSGMVGEFPELQGVMGRYYALNDGEPAEVARAVAEHYAPLGPGDACPSAPVSVAVSLADKLDTLAGFWAIGETPTGSKDPFALRRAALGVIRLIVENGLRLPLATVLGEAVAQVMNELKLRQQLEPIEALDRLVKEGRNGGRFVEFERGLLEALALDEADEERVSYVVDALLSFFADRMKVALRERGVRHDLVSAVFNLGGEDDLVRLLARVEALAAFLTSEDGANLLTAYRRAANIVRIEAKKDGRDYAGPADAALLDAAEEKALHAALEGAERAAGAALECEDFAGAMAALAALRAPVDAFFDRVTVNAEEAALRANRLALLAQIGATLGRVADFSAVEG